MANAPTATLSTFVDRFRQSREQERELAKSNPHLMDALAANKRQGQKLAIQARWAALGIIGIMLPFQVPGWSVLYYEFILLGFALLGWAQLRAGKVGRSRQEIFLLVCDLALLTLTITVPNPFLDTNWPIAFQYQLGNFQYFFIFLAAASLAYSWRTTIAVSSWTMVLWIAGYFLASTFGQQAPEITDQLEVALADYPLLVGYIDPNNFQLGIRIQEMVIFLIVAFILGLNGWRNNQLLLRQADIARERENLARHFPPGIVEQMADQDQPFAQVRSQPVAVMFADIVGFSKMAEQSSPDTIVAMLREFHALMENSVFNNHGTLDKFLGDGIMASFGTPETGPDDAVNALNCAGEMLASIDQWNAARIKQGEIGVKISIGIHYGDVVLGNIGSKRRLEFATLGDTVNVASRLEELTRNMDTQIIISDALVQAAKSRQVGAGMSAVENYQEVGMQALRGRDFEVGIWKLPENLSLKTA